MQKAKINFFEFLKKPPQKRDLILFLIFYVIVFVILKICYPYPDGFPDSGSYIAAAIRGGYDGYRPYGYSQFLILIHSFSSKLGAIVFLQYSINCIVTIFTLFSLKYFYPPQKKLLYYCIVSLIVGSFSIIYSTNMVLSDSIFASLTTLWLSLNLWFINTKKISHKVLLIILKFSIIYIIVNIRYTGLLYFGIEFLLLLFSQIRHSKKLAIASLASLLLLGINFYKNQIQKTNELVGIKTFSGFSGWLSTNNALHVLPYIDLDQKKIQGKSFEEFARFAKENDSLFVLKRGTTPALMWNNDKPQKQYLFHYMRTRNMTYLKAWTKLGNEHYTEFGRFIKINYPLEFFKHFIIPNAATVLHPPAKSMGGFRKNWLAKDLLDNKWYTLSPDQQITANYDVFSKISNITSLFRLFSWIALFLVLSWYIAVKGWKKMNYSENALFIFLSFFILVYAAFHIYSASSELRYIVPVNTGLLLTIYIFLNTSSLPHLISKSK